MVMSIHSVPLVDTKSGTILFEGFYSSLIVKGCDCTSLLDEVYFLLCNYIGVSGTPP